MPTGKFKPIPDLSAEQIEAFWKLVDKRGPDECWPWLGRRNGSGYGVFSIGMMRDFRATRVLLKITTGNDPAPLYAIHDCENRPTFIGRHCTNPSHILAGTHDENMAYTRGRPSGKDMTGSNNFNADLSEPDIIRIRERCAAGETIESIAMDYSVEDSMISHIKTGRNWKHVGGPTSISNCAPGRLTEENVRDILKMHSEGFSQQSIANRFGVSQGIIAHILNGRAWNTVTGLPKRK